jgi:hypothetical protein
MAQVRRSSAGTRPQQGSSAAKIRGGPDCTRSRPELSYASASAFDFASRSAGFQPAVLRPVVEAQPRRLEAIATKFHP